MLPCAWQDLAVHFPELLTEEMKTLLGLSGTDDHAAINEGETGGVEGLHEPSEGTPICVCTLGWRRGGVGCQLGSACGFGRGWGETNAREPGC